MIEEKKYNINDKNVKLCLLTDLHFTDNYDLTILDKIKENVKINRPDFICLSGDIIDQSTVINSNDIELLKKFIEELSHISQVIITLGNHDILEIKNNKVVPANFEEVNKWFLDLNKLENVYYLNNKSLVRGDICFTSYNPEHKYYEKEDVKEFIKDIDNKIDLNKQYYNVLLCHSPINVLKDITLKYSKQILKADLILSGHMHNGMILSIFDKWGNRGLIGPYYKLFPKYARGKITKTINNHKINLIISGGIIKLSSTNSKHLNKFNKLFPISIVYINI